MFKKFKKFMAFTLAELLIVFSIIGIVSAITIMTTKRIATTDKYAYQRAYDALRTAAYNAVAETDAKGIKTPDLLCEGLAKYINSQYATATGSDKFEGNPDKGFCNKIAEANRVGIDASDFDKGAEKKIVPDFVANNGMKFYITKKLKEEGLKDYTNTDSMDIEYYVVFVDIDGENGQNTIDSGDIVAFAITVDNADTIPLGAPIYDKHYLGVRVVFPENPPAHPDEYFSESMTYYDAIHTAWGNLHNFDDLRTFDFNEFKTLSGSRFMKIVNENNLKPETTPEQHDDCICNVADDENCKTTTKDEDRFECDIRIQRYY